MPANKDAKRKLLRLNSSQKTQEPEQNLNSSKEVEGIVYYSLEDMEVVVQAILAELSSDPSIGVTLEPSETGITLNCVPQDGEEYAVDVDLNSETLEEDAPVDPAGEIE